MAAGGVPTDLQVVLEAIDGGPASGLGLAVLVGLAHAHRDPRLWGVLTERGRAAAALAATLDASGLVRSHPEPLATWTGRDRPWEDEVWQAVLGAERNPGGTPGVPVHLYHARRDEVVPAALTRRLASDYAARGVPVTHVELDAPDHLSGGILGARGAVEWLATELAAHLLSHPGGSGRHLAPAAHG